MTVLWEPTLDADAAGWRDLARRTAAERFAPLAEELDREQRYPHEHIATFVETGLSGMLVPAEFGGAGLSMTAISAVVEEVSAACASTGAILAAHALGAVPVRLAGTDDQKRDLLGPLRAGEAISFALTEQGAGSDAAAIRTRAEADGDGYRLTGEKIYIGNGSVSTRYVVFAKTDPGAGARGITAFVVPADAPGVVIDRIEDKMGIRGTRTSNLKLDNVRVAAADVLGQVNRGLKLAFQTLDLGRVSVAAQGLGIAHAAYRLAAAEATRRHTFGRPVVENQGIGFRLADLAVELSAARMLTYQAAAAYDAGQPVSMPGAMAKLYTSEVAHRAVDLAVQVYGGDGFCKPCPAERLYRDQRVLEIYEGSSEIQRLVLSRAIAAEAAA
ncbi:acyl-CoA dehydrogenase family protein [Actinophytocola algeriensis]|uniref:Alkylation response protein AidB-like acyl-CoA dehydrogenase n=1 Tax=Actinophytocola algeriensis TaxID=1768010 RepID=A0A7W7QC81_9PSEU|nr:acyl-CoA dehydrogenase family protein [Actinophytocola algeriensis]MBB4910899.1 alkylation response protein AidB-like acyl-CoA dehydrogenase [Actinophytocola algeriensis]MBE1473892.1 alkylation response protein AidB-like acyl-CoA dehydrogenase [Actinophytocola algeriensis]